MAQQKLILCFPRVLSRMYTDSWMVPIVPDDFKLGVAGVLQTCSNIVSGLVCDGVKTGFVDWELLYICKLTIQACVLHLTN